MGKLAWDSILVLMLALAFCACAMTKPAPKQTSNATAAGDSEASMPSAAPEYFEMVKALADRINGKNYAMGVMDPSGNIIQEPDFTKTQPLPWRFRAPTAAEIEKMGPIWPKVPPEKNAAYYFVKAILGQADDKEAPPGAARSLRPYVGDVEALAKWVELNRLVLETMREGMKLDVYCMPVGIVDEAGEPQPLMSLFSGLRQIAGDLTDAGFVEEVKGNPERAATYYLECVQFGKKFHNATVIESVEGIAVQAMGQRALDDLVANATLSDKMLRGVIAACREAEVAQDAPARFLATESALSKAQAALDKAPYRDNPAALLGARYGKVFRDFAAPKPLDELLQKKVLEASYKNELKEFVGKGSEGILRWDFTEWGRINVRLRATQIRAAIALYRKANGRLPDSLDALCPDLLPSVPIDPFSGKPMRYAKTADGWKIWSVGPKNVDHGGEPVKQNENGVISLPLDNIVYPAQVPSNIERRSKEAIKSLPAPAEKPKEAK